MTDLLKVYVLCEVDECLTALASAEQTRPFLTLEQAQAAAQDLVECMCADELVKPELVWQERSLPLAPTSTWSAEFRGVTFLIVGCHVPRVERTPTTPLAARLLNDPIARELCVHYLAVDERENLTGLDGAERYDLARDGQLGLDELDAQSIADSLQDIYDDGLAEGDYDSIDEFLESLKET